MKTSKYIYSFMLAVALAFAGCSDFLDSEDNSNIAGDNFYQTEDDFRAATAPLYNKVWFDFNDKFYYGLGDGRGFNLCATTSNYIYPFADLTETGLTGPLVSAWGSLYNIVQQTNKIINGIKGNSSNSEEVKNPYIAEARFMRGVAYSYLAMLWGNVIINEDTDELVANPIVNTSPVSDVYEFAMRDLEFAAKYLPEVSSAAGRVNKYSAFGMLSRVYLTYAGYSSNPNSATRNQDYLDLAKKAALKVIENRNFELMTEYADLFMIDKNNNSETLFALQWVSNGTYGECNTIQDYFACESAITGNDRAWGGYVFAQPDVIWEYEKGDKRRQPTWMAYGDHYPEIQKANGGYTCESAITGNDRAWGGYVFAQPDVIWEYEKGDKRRQPTWMAYGDHYPEIQKANGGYTCEKKASGTVSGIYCKKYVCGSSKDNAKITSGSTPINTYMLRLAEVYLIYAEAILGNNPSTDDADAMEYFNKVRKRAGLEPQNSITYEDIRRERRLELCLEGQYWYDLVRRAYYKQQEVLNYITGQDRGTAIPVVWDADTQTLKRDEDSDETKRAIGDVDSSIFLLPYPESETVQNPLLKADPMPYAFKEDRITDLFN